MHSLPQLGPLKSPTQSQVQFPSFNVPPFWHTRVQSVTNMNKKLEIMTMGILFMLLTSTHQCILKFITWWIQYVIIIIKYICKRNAGFSDPSVWKTGLSCRRFGQGALTFFRAKMTYAIYARFTLAYSASVVHVTSNLLFSSELSCWYTYIVHKFAHS